MNSSESGQDVEKHGKVSGRPDEIPDSERERSCFLCQSVNRTLSTLCTPDKSSIKLKKLIQRYLKIKVNHLDETNGFVCVDCIEKLNSLKWFDHQGKKNDHFLKAFPEQFMLQNDRYCRLCLCTTNRLQAIFVENDQTSNNPLCDLIKECIGLEIDYYRDFTSNICALCRTQLEMFVTFKRIAKQLQLEEGPSANGSEEKSDFAEPQVAKRKTSSSDAEEPLLEVMSYEYEATSKKKRRYRVKAKAEKTKNQQLESNEPTKPEGDDDVWVKSGRQKIYRILWTADDERNFEVIKEKKLRVRIRRDGYTFSLSTAKRDGSTVWICDYKVLHSCKFQLTLDANGKIATMTKGMVHTHDSEPVRLLKCPVGKGIYLNHDVCTQTSWGSEETFWLVGVKTVGKENERHLIFRGHEYILRTCNVIQDTSRWECKDRHCQVAVQVRGIFKYISISKGTHNHPQISNGELQQALKDGRVSTSARLDDVITRFRDRKVPAKEPLKRSLQDRLLVPEVYTKLASEEDDSREFIALKVRDDLYKIRYLGYDYKLYLRQNEGATLWKCLWEKFYNCKAIIEVSADVKKATYYGLSEHNHSLEPAPIFLCELGQYLVRNLANDALENMKLLNRECTYFRSRTLLYRLHAYNLYQIINEETRWMCVKSGSQGQQCCALIIITGSMESFLRKGDHCHLPMSASEVESIVKPDNVVELSALEHQRKPSKENACDTADSGSPNDDVLDMLKQQLLAFPIGRGSIWDMKESRQHPFYFVIDHQAQKKNDPPYTFFYQHYRYAFASIDEYGTSQWICCKLLETGAREGTCTARATMEGVFQRVLTKGTHNHDGITDSLVEYLCNKTETKVQ